MSHPLNSDFELNDEELHLYSRQILLDQWDIEAQERLKLSNVVIIGAGGIGCMTAELLARAGVGKITLVDGDTIEMSNLQRQIAFNPQHIGQFKAEVLAKHLQEINPLIHISYHIERLTKANTHRFIAAQDLVLDGCDNFATRYVVNAACKQYAVPLISASAIGLQGQLLMTDADSACYACLFPEQDQVEHTLELNCTASGVLATTPNVMAALQAHHALLFLGLNLTPLREKILLWDGLKGTQKIMHFEKDTNCEIC